MSLAYHLDELRIACDPHDAAWMLPSLRDSERTIVDIGCGIGQSLVALGCVEQRECIGVDIDEEALAYGRRHHGRIRFVRADASRMPMLRDASVDLVVSRVSMPYTNIPRGLDEIGRILRPGGRLWATLHSKSFAAADLRRETLKERLYFRYVMLNGHLLQATGRLLPFPDGRYESWQDLRTMQRLLQRRGFEATTGTSGQHAVLEAIRLAA